MTEEPGERGAGAGSGKADAAGGSGVDAGSGKADAAGGSGVDAGSGKGEVAGGSGTGRSRPTGEEGATEVFYCDLCGNVMLNLHCKLICERCGYRRDCSDP